MELEMPNVPRKFESGFPEGYQNTLPNWGFFSREELETNKGKLLLLDIDLDRYCSLHCPDCFRHDSEVDSAEDRRDLSFGELIKVVEDGKKLGLKYVKICGVGEPTESGKLLPFIEIMTNMGIGTAVFTKGQGLGNDDIAKRFHRRYGINTARELAERMYHLNVSFMLGFHSFNPVIQDHAVRTPGYTQIRDTALENLVNAGFTDSSPTRLAFCNAPVRSSTANDAFLIYVWARERNIYPVTAVLMTSGKQIDTEFLRQNDLTHQQKVELWTNIYSWNIEHGLQTLEEIEADGISCLPGGHPCNQLRAGLYVTMKGNVVGCPGYIENQGNVRKQSLAEIWEQSKTRKIAGDRFNTGCPPKEGITIPDALYAEVLSNLQSKYGSKESGA
jgi:MoaA/NifB/PqqE/SkfB family radical SAM enzyme